MKYFMLFSIVIFGSLVVSAQPVVVHAVKEETSVTYKLVHPLHEIEATSKDVEFQAELDTAKREIKSVSAVVDVMSFDSGNSNRDSHAMEVVDAIDFPEVKFTSTSITQLADTLTVSGKLTFHGVTKEVKMNSVSTWSDKKLDVRGTFNLSLTDFKVDRPSLLMIPVNDTLRFTVISAFAW